MKTSLLLGLLALSSHANASGFSFRVVHDLNDELDHIEAEASFDGQLASCIIDTGARFTLAKEELLANNRKVGEEKGGGISGVQRITDLVEARIQIGDWARNPGVIGRTKAGTIPAACLLGNDFFLNRAFSIDFASHRFEDIPTIEGSRWPLKTYPSGPGGHFGFELEVAGQKIDSLFDTGATSTVFDTEFVAAHRESFEFVQEIPVQEGSNQTVKAGIYRVRSLRFADVELSDVKVYVLSLKVLQDKIPNIQAVLGLEQMMDRKWFFDPRNSVWNSQAR